jgi:D-alanine-D-alanine ligase
LRLVILYDSGARDGVADWTAEDIRSVMQPVNQIAKIMSARGYEARRVAVRHDLRWLAEARRADLVVNLCEGIHGVSRFEDMVTSTLELAGVPFTGCRAWTTMVCHNKALLNALLQSMGLPIPRWFMPRGHKVPKDFPLPAIVKPAAEDASVGIDQGSVVTTKSALTQRIARLTEEFNDVVVQQYVAGREIAVGFVGNTTLPISEIDFGKLPDGSWPILSFDAKWTKGSADDLGTQPVVPARVDAELEKRIVAVAREAWQAVEGTGYGRVDLRVDEDGQPWIIEVNPNPDISDDAGLSRMAHAAGWSFPDLIVRIAEAALADARTTASVAQLASSGSPAPRKAKGRQTA